MRAIATGLLAAAALALCAAVAAASAGPLPAGGLSIASSGLPGMRGAHKSVFWTLSVDRWAQALSGAEGEMKAYGVKLFERGFQQGVETRLEGRREGRLRREVLPG